MSADPRTQWADRFAEIVLANLGTRYPYAAHHLMADDDDRELPRVQHPSFGNSFDWHSSAHMHWLGVQLLGFGLRDAGLVARLEDALTVSLSAQNLAVEAGYLRANPGYERPYGWAWALALAAAVRSSPVPALRALDDGFAPLREALSAATVRWLATTPEPVRHGVHSNSAFALRHLLAAAETLGLDETAAAVRDGAVRWFGRDIQWPFRYERSAYDFLSPGLAEADLLRVVLPAEEFAVWSRGFLAELSDDDEALRPVVVLDEHDGQQVHRYGLDLHRAAALARLARALEGVQPGRARRFADAALGLLPAGLAAATGEEYYSTHWLATFAWDALSAIEGGGGPVSPGVVSPERA